MGGEGRNYRQFPKLSRLIISLSYCPGGNEKNGVPLGSISQSEYLLNASTVSLGFCAMTARVDAGSFVESIYRDAKILGANGYEFFISLVIPATKSGHFSRRRRIVRDGAGCFHDHSLPQFAGC